MREPSCAAGISQKVASGSHKNHRAGYYAKVDVALDPGTP
jgi:hypothetical protein